MGSTPARREQPSEPDQRRESTYAPRSAPSTGAGGLYIISVAARLLEMHPQTLRKYERAGLISPPRTEGMLRLYSQQDIARLRLIKHLVDNVGLNLAGVEFVLGLINHLHAAQERLRALEIEQQFKEMMGRELEEMFDLLDIAFEDLGQQ